MCPENKFRCYGGACCRKWKTYPHPLIILKVPRKIQVRKDGFCGGLGFAAVHFFLPS